MSNQQLSQIPEMALIVSLDGREFLDIPDAGRIFCYLNPTFAKALLMELDDVKNQIKGAWNAFNQKGREISAYTITFKRQMTCKGATVTILPDGTIKMTDVTCTFTPRSKILPIRGNLQICADSVRVHLGAKPRIELMHNQQPSSRRDAQVVVVVTEDYTEISCSDGGPLNETENEDGSVTFDCK